MTRTTPVLLCFVCIATLAVSVTVKASIPPYLVPNDADPTQESRQYTLFFASYRDLGRGQDARSIQPVSETPFLTQDDMKRIIPTNQIAGGSTETQCAKQIATYSLGNFMQSDAVQKSDMGKSAKTVEKNMSSEAGFGGDEPGDVRHVFQFNMKPTETKAEMKYEGLTNARLTYSMVDSKLGFEVFENLDKVTKIGFNDTFSHVESIAMVKIAWAF